MAMIRYPRGSEWRKWDLQIHTPYSCLNNGFGGDFDDYAKQLFDRAIEDRIAAIGITDYFSIEGYKQLKAMVDENGRLESLLGTDKAVQARDVLLLPNIELRTSVIIRDHDGKDSRVNFHVIFSDHVSPTEIEEHFLRDLKFNSESTPGKRDEKHTLTIANLENLGRKLKEDHADFAEHSDLFIGMMNAVIPHEDVTEVLERQDSRFKGLYLLAVPSDEDLSKVSWSGQGHLSRKLLIQKSHLLMSGNPTTREFGLGRKHASVDAFIEEFKSLKPSIHGSDAHDFQSLFRPALNRHTWIKADPTFHGLLQVLCEPETRVYVGDVPPGVQKVEQNSTKYMSQVRITKDDPAISSENWFDCDLPLNHGLIAIIGNKGSGKSALADVLALLGNSPAFEHFSFLNKERFLSPKARLGSMFHAEVAWRSGSMLGKSLDAEIDLAEPMLVKYIPQNFLEIICSELQESNGRQFYQELMDVIFSHVDEPDRLGKSSLADLIEYLTKETEIRINQIAGNLSVLNQQVTALEEQATAAYRRALETQLKQRRDELKAHVEAKPTPVLIPEQDPDAQAAASAITTQIELVQEKIAELDEQIKQIKNRDGLAATRIAVADKLLARIDNLEKEYHSFLEESEADVAVLELDLGDLVALNIDKDPITEVRSKAEEIRASARTSLDPELDGSLATRLEQLHSHANELRASLDEPNQNYQLYIQALKDWEERHSAIEGSPESLESVKYLESRLKELEDLPAKIEEFASIRTELTMEIFGLKENLLAKYRELHAPVQEFIDQHPISKQHGALQFRASITVDGLENGLLNMIHQGRTGSFYGESEGRNRLQDLVKAADFNSAEGTLKFVSEVLDSLKHDYRESTHRPTRLSDQLRQGFAAKDVYDFLFNLRYLRPHFELRWNERPISQLSPGERGNLLLIFYLLIDKRDFPLIIDQPEENLDNQTVSSILAPAVKEAKERRQIVMVTHNPNLAVVCDADQVIHANISKESGNRITYTAGSIENPEINQMIVDVLEGTKPAFDLRDSRYEILELPN